MQLYMSDKMIYSSAVELDAYLYICASQYSSHWSWMWLLTLRIWQV